MSHFSIIGCIFKKTTFWILPLVTSKSFPRERSIVTLPAAKLFIMVCRICPHSFLGFRHFKCCAAVDKYDTWRLASWQIKRQRHLWPSGHVRHVLPGGQCCCCCCQHRCQMCLWGFLSCCNRLLPFQKMTLASDEDWTCQACYLFLFFLTRSCLFVLTFSVAFYHFNNFLHTLC